MPAFWREVVIEGDVQADKGGGGGWELGWERERESMAHAKDIVKTTIRHFLT